MTTSTHRDAGESVATPEGPLARAARTASEEAYLASLTDVQREAWEKASGARPERTSKRLLVALSHTIEKAVMSGPIEQPTVVLAMFQKMKFFDREREVYERMAAAGIEVVVGFAEDEPHEAPEGVHVVVLGHDEPLADEWTVVAVGPDAGAFLVATDQHHHDPGERDVEASREFTGRWGYSRTQAGTELARLRFALGDRLDASVRRTIDGMLAAAMPTGGDRAASAGTPGETWATTSLHHMISRMQSARAGTRELREQLADAQRAAAARSAATVDPQSGVSTPDFLRRWANPSDGATALPIGLALFDVPELDGETVRADDRASYHAAHQVAAALSQPLGAIDAVVRLSVREFLVVVPGASTQHLAGLCDTIGENLELASHGYPDISLRARAATIVTRSRPFPLGDLSEALNRLGENPGPVDAGEIPAGDRIVVSSTALHDHRAPTARSAPRPAAAGTAPIHAPAPELAPAAADGPSRSDSGRSDSDRGSDRGDSDRAAPGMHSSGLNIPSRHSPSPSPSVPGQASGDREMDRRPGGPGPSEAGVGGQHRSPAPRLPVPPAPENLPPARREPGPENPPHTPHAENSLPDDMLPPLPHRTAQEALRRLVHGDETETGGDPRARDSVFTDLSGPANGHGSNGHGSNGHGSNGRFGAG
ncbi:diguanylate cyclase/two-component system sensory protein [Pseudonocardia sediminis]|uniref:Diguanylate cyclase/two-component system sensory protein n=1 Tax=Pseudonocardia sediminis TaxID=1397368 RepID=A0A4Q7V3A4_PSEST|nr:DICT sensory domain-containing protein [Pseudonocardia sediminis]RZT88876.1 diguanylate cyclase/two-component system sensory protein [Pseudonocardia sediminis]